MSLSKKISDEMAQLAYRIIQKAGKETDNDKLRRMVAEYNNLDRLLKKASELETP